MIDAIVGASGRQFLRYRVMSKGEIENEHTHPFPHDTLLATGSIKHIDGREFKAPALFPVAAGAKHGWVALEDNTVTCCIIRREDFEKAYGPIPDAHI